MLFNVFKPRKKHLSVNKPDISEFTGELYPRQPRVKLLSNEIISDFLCDSGASFIRSKDCDLTGRPYDLLRKAKGVFCYATYNKKSFCATYAPEYMKNVEYETAFSKSAVSYFAKSKELKITTQIRLHSIIGCEQREYLFENRLEENLDVSALIVFEPLFEADLTKGNFEKASPQVFWDKDSNAIAIEDENTKNCIAVGFLENKAFLVRSKTDLHFEDNNDDEGICHEIKANQVAISFSITLEKREQKSLHFVLVYGKTKSEALASLRMIRNQPPIDSTGCAKQKSFENPMAKRITQTLLPQLLFSKRDSGVHLDYAFSNTANVDELSGMFGISIDMPIVTVDIFSQRDKERILAYVQSYLYIKKSFLNFNLVFVCDGTSEIEKAVKDIISEAVKGELHEYKKSITVISTKNISAKKYDLLHAASCHIAARSLVRIEVPSPQYTPVFPLNCDAFDKKSGSICMVKEVTDGEVISQVGYAIGLNESKTMDGIELSSSTILSENKSIKINISVKSKISEAKKATISYYNELLFNQKRNRASMIKSEYLSDDNILVLFNPVEEFNLELDDNSKTKGRWLAIASTDKEGQFCCDRANFLSGNITNTSFPPLYEPCLALSFNKDIELSKSMEIKIFVSVAETKETALSFLQLQLSQG